MAANTHHQPLLGLDSPKSSTSKPLCLIFSLIALLCSATLLASIHLTKTDSSHSPPPLQGICDHAYDIKASCLDLVSELSTNTTTETNRIDLLDHLLRDSTSHIEKTIEKVKLVRLKINEHREQQALADCVGLMELSIDRIHDSIAALRGVGTETDAHTWLSTVLTNHVTCRDGLTGRAKSAIEPELMDLTLGARTSLAVLVSTYNSPTPKEEKSIFFPLKGDFPSWVTKKDRKLLGASAMDINANVVVAQDGSGKYKTVKEAVASAPDNSKARYVIYVKKGTYKENVEVGKTKKNLMLTGDGMSATIITGSLNVVDGSTTFNSATLAAVGDGFIAQDIWFQNTAGPQKHQAVALRVGADQAVINRCQIDAYQDTLYAHSNRQFFRDSYITGTVDFIFGNAAVVFQNCKLVARKPMTGQSNMVTAQGREDPNQNTGTSIQKCNVIASSDLAPVKGSIHSYLGRPWKAYSRTVYMQSYIGDHIDPTGWSVWDGDFALKTLYYGEYLNNGPGSSTSSRVKWAGYRVITSAAEAQKFTVAQLIQGGSWLAPSGVTFSEGL